MHKRKMSVGSVIGIIILGGLMVALMIYTATRTVDFLQMTFPKSMAYVAYLALAAFDGGIIGWTIFATSSAEGAMQRGIAYLMIFVDILGVVLTTVADTTTISAQNGIIKLDPNMAAIGMWGSMAIIILNVVAIVVTHLVAPHHVRKFELENVHDSIHQLTMQHIKDRAIEIAPRIAAEHADHWVRQTIQDVVGSLPASSQTRQIEASKVIDADRSKLVYAPSSDQVLDPGRVKIQVENEKKKIEKKPLIDFSLPKGVSAKMTQKIDTAVVTPDKDEDETIENGPSDDDPSKWTMADWRQYRNEVDAWTFDHAWTEEYGDTPFPDDRLAARKGKGGKKAKNLTRREVLGMENQDD